MENVLKKAGIDSSPNIITASTDVKDVSSKRALNMVFGIVLGILGVITSILTLYAFVSIFTNPYGWGAILGLIFVFFFALFLTIILFALAQTSISSKSDWFFVLYDDHLHYKYRVEKPKGFKDIKLNIEDIQKCFILRKEIVRLGKPGKISEFHISIHFQYEKDGGMKYLSIRQMDGYSEFNKTLSYLQSEKKIPLFFAVTYEEFKKADECHAYENADELHFDGDLKLYDKKTFVHKSFFR